MEISELLRRVPAGATTVLIDGRSGSGKTSLAHRLCRAWPGSEVISLDDIYPGWGGLLWASDHVRTELLTPRAAGAPGRWRRWDWSTGAPAGWHTVEPGQRVIVEGVGALTPGTRALADLGVWLEMPAAERKRRALERDGETFAPHWDRWATQEREFIARHHPRSVADVVIELPAARRG